MYVLISVNAEHLNKQDWSDLCGLKGGGMQLETIPEMILC